MHVFHTRRSYYFFFNDTATTEIYTLSLHDALPISATALVMMPTPLPSPSTRLFRSTEIERPLRSESVPVGLKSDRKSTRLNSSHANISYAVFCLKKKKTQV